MFFNILYKSPISKDESLDKRITNIFLIGLFLYVMLYSLLYSKLCDDYNIITQHKQCILYLFMVDITLFSILAKWYYNIPLYSVIEQIITGKSNLQPEITYVKSSNENLEDEKKVTKNKPIDNNSESESIISNTNTINIRNSLAKQLYDQKHNPDEIHEDMQSIMSYPSSPQVVIKENLDIPICDKISNNVSDNNSHLKSDNNDISSDSLIIMSRSSESSDNKSTSANLEPNE